MSFYEGSGPDLNPRFTMDLKGKSNSVNTMFFNLMEKTNLPLEVVEILAEYTDPLPSKSCWETTRASEFGGAVYKSPLSPSFTFKYVSSCIKMFKDIETLGSLKLLDIKSLEYSILAFNESPTRWCSIKESVAKFNARRDSFFHLDFQFIDRAGKKYNFGAIINDISCIVGPLKNNEDKRSSLKSYWFPKMDEYFHSNRAVSPMMITSLINDFIEDCREAVKGRK